MLTFFVNIGMVMVVYSGGLRVIQGSMTDGQIMAFTNYLTTTMGPLLMMTMLANTWANGIASARRVNEVLDTSPEVQDVPRRRRSARDSPGPRGISRMSAFTTTAAPIHRAGSDQPDGRAGQTVAILGATGAGKSSLINLIPRFYDPSQGRILIDGVDIRDSPAGLAAGPGRDRAAGDDPVLRHRARQYPLRHAQRPAKRR